MRFRMAGLMMVMAFGASAQDLRPDQITKAYQWCSNEAHAKCGRNTHYCDGYRRGFLKICLTNAGVPPDYIFMLLN